MVQEPDELRYENERLKQALATSGTNAKKWEHELQVLFICSKLHVFSLQYYAQTLKATNLKLKSALKESAVNVEDWRRQVYRCNMLDGPIFMWYLIVNSLEGELWET